MRLTIIDGFRGFFLIFMMVAHTNPYIDATIGRLNHHAFGWVEDAQGFVFISGFVIGLVYGGRYLRSSFKRMRSSIFARILTIFKYHASLIALLALSAMVLFSMGYAPGALSSYMEEPILFSLSSMMLISGSEYMRILPMYIWFLLVTPLVLAALRKGHHVSLIIICAGLWLLAQTGLIDYLMIWIESELVEVGYGGSLGIYFNVFAWQTVFFSGVALGFAQAQGRLDLSFLRAPEYQTAFLFGLAAFVALGIYDRIVFDHLISGEYSGIALASLDRGNFSIVYFLAFYLDLFLITWLLVAGSASNLAPIRALSRVVDWLFTRRPLVFLGQHSLQVFSWHVVVAYLIMIMTERWRPSEVEGSLLLFLSIASLYLPAALHARHQRRGAARATIGRTSRADA